MNTTAARIFPSPRASVRTSARLRRLASRRRRGGRRLQDQVSLFVYGGFTREDLEHYASQPDTLAGLISARTGSPIQTVREWVQNALPSWRRT